MSFYHPRIMAALEAGSTLSMQAEIIEAERVYRGGAKVRVRAESYRCSRKLRLQAADKLLDAAKLVFCAKHADIIKSYAATQYWLARDYDRLRAVVATINRRNLFDKYREAYWLFVRVLKCR